jgi:hypothetical protein
MKASQPILSATIGSDDGVFRIAAVIGPFGASGRSAPNSNLYAIEQVIL